MKLVQPVTYFFMFVLIAFMAIVSFFDVKKMLPQSWTNSLELKIHRASGEMEESGETEEAAAPESSADAEDAETQARTEVPGETPAE